MSSFFMAAAISIPTMSYVHNVQDVDYSIDTFYSIFPPLDLVLNGPDRREERRRCSAGGGGGASDG